MTLPGNSESPDPGGLWNLTFRWDEFGMLDAALAGVRLTAEQADQAELVRGRLHTMMAQIERQAR